MNYISQKINKLFKLDSVISMLKFDFNVEKITILLSVMVISYIILIPMYNLFKKILIVNNKENSQSITQRKYRKITSQVCSGCISSSKSSKSYKSSKSIKNNKCHKKIKKNNKCNKKINKSLRKIDLKNNF